jgi:AbrB family looped-hinge helix DNA binding protein
MAVVRVHRRGQVTIPARLRERAGIAGGDLLDARVERGKIVFTPTSLIEREIAQGMDDVRRGRLHGPYESADEAIRALHGMLKKTGKRPAPGR